MVAGTLPEDDHFPAQSFGRKDLNVQVVVLKWPKLMQTIAFGMNKRWGPAAWHGELCPVICDRT